MRFSIFFYFSFPWKSYRENRLCSPHPQPASLEENKLLVCEQEWKKRQSGKRITYDEKDELIASDQKASTVAQVATTKNEWFINENDNPKLTFINF